MNVKKKIIPSLESKILDDNGCKLLNSGNTRKVFWYFRSRKNSSSYYLVRIKGNFIKAWKMHYVVDGEPVNLFASVGIPALFGEIKKPVFEKTLISKKKLKEIEDFVKELRNKSDDLEWDT